MDEILLGILALGAWAFVAWVAYDCGYDKGWWDGNTGRRNG